MIKTTDYLQTLGFGLPSIASIDLTWSGKYHRPDPYGIFPRQTWNKDVRFWDDEMEADELIIDTHEIVLLTSAETVQIPNQHAALLVSKSTPGRRGLIHAHAGLFEYGFDGLATWEMFNAMPWPVIIKKGQALVQLVFFEAEDSAAYQGQYGGSKVT